MAESKRAGAATLDFSNVSEGGTFNKKRVPMGDYLAKVTKVEDRPVKESKEPQWLFTIQLVGKYTDRKFPYYCKLEANQLWKIRNLWLAAGMAIPKKKVKLDPNRIVGKNIAVTLEDDEYDNKLQSTIAQTFPPSELMDDSDSDDDSEYEDDTEEEDEEEEAEEETDDSEEEDEEDEEEDEEPAPVPRKAAAKKTAARIPAQRKASPPAKKASAKRPPQTEDVDEDELEELDIESI